MFYIGDDMKICTRGIRKIIIAAFILYFYNILFIKCLPIIPINLITILIITFFDIFGLIGLIIFYVFL